MTGQTIGPVTVEASASGWRYVVRVVGKRARTFHGESAWSDAERYANDALLQHTGTPFGDRFVL